MKLVISLMVGLASLGHAAQDTTSLYGVTQSTTSGRAVVAVVGSIELSTSAYTKGDPSIILNGRQRRLTVSDATRTNVTTMTPTGFAGNLTGNVTGNVTGASSLNVLKTGDAMTGQLTNTSTITIQGNAFSVGVSSFQVKAGQVGVNIDTGDMGATTAMTVQAKYGSAITNPIQTWNNTSEQVASLTGRGYLWLQHSDSSVLGGITFGDDAMNISAQNVGGLAPNKITISTNTYIVGYSSASMYYGDGSQLTGSVDSTRVSKAGDNMTGQLTTTSTITIQGSGFSVGGSTFVIAGGKVGIGGDASASTPLTVTSSATAVSLNIINTNGQANLQLGGTTIGIITNTTGEMYMGNAAAAGGLNIRTANTTRQGIDYLGNFAFLGSTMTIKTTGQVGINNDPESGFELQVQPRGGSDTTATVLVGSSGLGGRYQVNGVQYYGIDAYFDNVGVGKKITFRVSDASAIDTTAMTIKATGMVGIGTTAPGTKLHVSSGVITVDGTGAGIYTTGNSTAAYYYGDGSPLTGQANSLRVSTATYLATAPGACAAGEYISGLAADGTKTCGTPAGAGDVLLSSSQTFTGSNTFSQTGTGVTTISSAAITSAVIPTITGNINFSGTTSTATFGGWVDMGYEVVIATETNSTVASAICSTGKKLVGCWGSGSYSGTNNFYGCYSTHTDAGIHTILNSCRCDMQTAGSVYAHAACIRIK